MKLPFPEIPIPPPPAIKVDMEFEGIKAMAELNARLDLLRPHIQTIRKFTSAFLCTTLKGFASHGLSDEVLFAWIYINARNPELFNTL